MAISYVFNPFTGTFDEISSVALAPVGSSPNANAATITSPNQVLTLQPADATHPGVITAGAQTIGGVKTFESVIIDPLAGDVGLTINAASGQTANLLEWYDQFSARQGLITNQGSIHTTADILANGLRINGMDYPNTFYNNGNPISIAAANGAGLIIDSANRVAIAAGTPTLTAQFAVLNELNTQVAEIVQGAASQSADLT